MRALADIVNEFLIRKNRNSKHEFPKYLMFAIQGLKQLEYDVNGIPKTVKLSIDGTNYTAALPLDCVNPISVDVRRGEELFPLYRNQNLNALTTDECGDEVTVYSDNNPPLEGLSSISYTTTHMNRNGEYIGRNYGQSFKPNGSFRITDKRIEFGTDISDSAEIFLTYIANPQQVDGKYMVHEYLVEPLWMWMEYDSNRFKRSVGAGEKKLMYQNFLNSSRLSRMRFLATTARVYEQLSRRGTKQSKQ